VRNNIISGLILACFILCPILGCQKQLSEEEKFKIILVTDVAGLGDKGFNDAGWAGLSLLLWEAISPAPHS